MASDEWRVASEKSEKRGTQLNAEFAEDAESAEEEKSEERQRVDIGGQMDLGAVGELER